MIVYGVCMVTLQYPVVRVAGRRDLMLALSLSCIAQGAGIGAAAFGSWPGTLVCIAAIAGRRPRLSLPKGAKNDTVRRKAPASASAEAAGAAKRFRPGASSPGSARRRR